MSEYIFFFRRKDTDDRDCCAYIEKQPRFECGHYFGSVTLHGACYCNHDFPDYENIETILTKKEYNAIINFSKEINDLGYGIKKNDERYKKGFKEYEKVSKIFAKLESDKAKQFQQMIIDSEVEYMKKTYGLSDEDIELIFSNYYLDYRDRGIIGCIFEDTEELGYEEAFQLGYIDRNTAMERYFNFEKFGEDLLEEDQYLKLSDGRVVYLNY